MTNKEVATTLVALCKEFKFEAAVETLYADAVVSVEPMEGGGMPRETHGKPGVLAKGAWWRDNHEVHSMTVEGPFVSPEFFVVIFHIDVTFKPTGNRIKGSEAGIYTVADGKVIREEFLGGV